MKTLTICLIAILFHSATVLCNCCDNGFPYNNENGKQKKTNSDSNCKCLCHYGKYSDCKPDISRLSEIPIQKHYLENYLIIIYDSMVEYQVKQKLSEYSKLNSTKKFPLLI